jgi:integrase
MVWVQIVRRKVKGRRDGAKGRTRFRARVWWPGDERRSKTDRLSFARASDAERRGHELVEAVAKHEAGFGPDPFAEPKSHDLASLLRGYREAVAAGALGKKKSQGTPTGKHVKMQANRLERLASWLSLRTLADFARLAQDVDVRMHELQAAHRWNDNTRDEYVAVLKQFGKWCKKTGRWPFNLLEEAAFVATDASQGFERRALTVAELEAVVMAAPIRPVVGYRKSHPHAPAEKLAELKREGWTRGTYYLLAGECGWRRGELAETTWAQLSIDDAPFGIRVRAQDAKAKRGGWVPFSAVVAARLREHRDRMRKRGPVALSDRVLSVPRDLHEHLRLDAAYAGLGEAKRETKESENGNRWTYVEWHDPAGAHVELDVHSLRTTFGTHVVESVDAKTGHELMRHGSIATTLRHYAKARPGRLEEMAAKLPRVSAGVLSDRSGDLKRPQVKVAAEHGRAAAHE